MSTIIIDLEHLIDHIAEVTTTEFTATRDHTLPRGHIVIIDQTVTTDLKTEIIITNTRIIIITIIIIRVILIIIILVIIIMIIIVIIMI